MHWSRARVARRGVAAVATVLLSAAAVALLTVGRTPDRGAAVRAAVSAPAGASVTPAPAPAPPPVPTPLPGSAPSAPPVELLAQTPAAPTADPVATTPVQPPEQSFAHRHPAQAAATQDPADPATTRWALLIGVNEHLGQGVIDNVGSRQDAEELRAHLLASGWRDDHILLLTDRQATRSAITDGLAWLAEKTDPRSTAVFHYSGHAKLWDGVDHDGDGEVTDEGLWPTDGRFIPDSELVRLLDPVDASATWISFATCNAAGFADPGLARPGRVLTFSSGEPQKSYENPAWDNSVWGFWMIDRGLGGGAGDLDGDGRVSVEEAWAWARPQARETTRGQRNGPQDAVIVDQLDGELHLAVPGSPAPPRAPAGDPTAPPEQEAAPGPAAAAEADPERQGGYLCLLCGG